MAGFNVAGLTAFTKPATEFLTAALVYPESYSTYDIQSNIQSTKRLAFMDASPVIQAYSCAMNASGGTSFSNKTITVVAMGTKTPYCLDDLKAKDIVGEYGTGTGKANPTLGSVLVSENTSKLAIAQNKMLWAGSLSAGDLMNGWLVEAKADSDVVSVTAATPTITTIDDVIEAMIVAVPEAVAAERSNIVIHVSQKYFNMYRANRIASNMYHDDPSNLGKNQMQVFGYPEYTIKAESGLVGKNDFLLTWDKNLVIGTDQVGEVANAKFVYVEVEENKNDTVYFIGAWKIGNTYKFGSEIVLFESM